MTEAEKISVSIQDEIYEEAQLICDKLNVCLLNFNDFSNLKETIKKEKILSKDIFDNWVEFELCGKNRRHWGNPINILYFKKYQNYKNRNAFTVKHLDKNTFFTEFHFFDSTIENLTIIARRENLKTDYNDVLREYIDCLEVFAEYIGYEMEIRRYNTPIGNNINHKIMFKKIK